MSTVMPKRKRLSDGDEADVPISSAPNTPAVEGRPKRRRNDTTLVDTIQFIFDAMRNKKKDDDMYLCEAFLRVPRKKTEPQYYEMIKAPIDMLKIQQKIKTDVYNDLEEFCKDAQLLVDNAKLYYAKSTEEYKDACELWEIFEQAKERAPEEISKEKLRQQNQDDDERGKKGRARPKQTLAMSAPMILEEDGEPMTSEDAVEELFGAVMTAMDPDGRLYSYDFRLLPPRDKYPEYYQYIENPIDLKLIAQRIQNVHYRTLDDIVEDFNLMFNNACAFNEPGSRIYKDARILKRLVQLRKGDLLQILNAKKSVRLRSKRSVANKDWSVLMSTLEEGMELPLPEEDSGGTEMPLGTAQEDDESDDDVDPDNPMWQLFLSVKNLSQPNDPNYQLVDPFKRLPNRRWHADYYLEIKNPIALAQIRKKIVKGEYRFTSEMVDDFNLMFDNAQQYNRPDSRIYRDAVKLQKFVQTKAEELMDEEDSDSDSDDTDSQTHKRRVGLSRTGRPLTFKRRAKILFKTLMDYMTEDGRQPIVAFIEKPDKREYPDYYEPIDMETIETKIRAERYVNEEELVTDFKLMFGNCQKYNEDGSVIYNDAITLERVLMEKIAELNQVDQSPCKSKIVKRAKCSPYVSTSKSMKALYNAIRDYRDNEGRQLSEVFLKLPSKSLYPDYYEVIKQPIDLEKILHKWKNNVYQNFDDMMADLTLMFQNACRYNEPDSQIYRDALTLQRHSLQKRLELSSSEDSVPNVGGLVQELLMSLFITVFNHEEEDGRYTAESFSDLPDYEEVEGKKCRVLSFDIMKRRLDKGMYTRLDHFQEDLFQVFEHARKHSKLNSRTFQDSITLQTEYIRVRDELCNHGSTLVSRALHFSEADLTSLIGNVKGERSAETETETMADDEDSKPPPQPTDGTNSSSVSHNEIQYFVGDFVYLTPPEKTRPSQNCEYPILHVERLWTNSEGRQMVYGCNYYRPAETFHQPNRKFFEQEVFKTDQHHAYPLTEVIGKCFVLPTVDYIKFKPEGVEEKDVYVCESRYNSRNRFFKKIKSFPFNVGDRVQLVERPEPLELKRVDSIFKERIERHKEELAELDEETKVIRRLLPNVAKSQPDASSGHTYFEQFNISSGAIKLGDFVYIKGREPGMKSIRQLCQLWVTAEGTGYFLGTIYKFAHDCSASGEQLCYKQEVYLTAGVETLPISDITGRCGVLDYKEYCSMRPTEIAESDVYICDSFFDELNQRVSSLQSGLRKFKLSTLVTPDEIYFFRKPVVIHKYDPTAPVIKKPMSYESSPMTPRMDMDYEDSMDGPPPSVASVDSGAMMNTPKSAKKPVTGKQFQQMTGKKQMTGYILFSAEIRKSITLKNPTANFGEISRLVGIEWKCLTETERKMYEDRAHQINLESAEKALSGNGPDSPQTPQQSSAQDLPLPNNPDVVFECMWDSCDHMFEDLYDLSEHLLMENGGHVHKVTQVFECAWRGCSRHKKSSLAPFPMVQRLVRHVREVHIQKNTGRIIQHQDRSRNFVASSRRSLVAQDPPQTTPAQGSYPTADSPHANIQGMLQARGSPYYQGMINMKGTPTPMGQGAHGMYAAVNGNAVQKSSEPRFVAPPPKTHRLLHSEAYIKYIENLEKPYISNWERHLMATQENTVINDSGRLPANWLGNGAGAQNMVVGSLWSLREYIMKDSLGIAKIL